MRGGTSKGVFFERGDLPAAAQAPGPERDALLLRVIGSPDPYGKHIDGMGGATSSTSKVVILSRSERPGYDVDYLFGQVSIDRPFIDWGGNCGNLTAAVGVFAVHRGLVDATRIPANGHVDVRIWQANIGKAISARVPIANGEVVETGDFLLDGVTFPAAEIPVTFHDPAGAKLFPTGQVLDTLEVPGESPLQATLINAGIPVIFLRADELGYSGTERQEDINQDPKALARFEKLRAYGALAMGLIDTLEAAATHQHVPKIAFVSPKKPYVTSSGTVINAEQIDVLVRALSMGQLHHAMMGTAAVAIAVAGAIPGTVVNSAAGGSVDALCFGHPSGTLTVSAEVAQIDDAWTVKQVTMRRSARVLMDGEVSIPYLSCACIK